MNQKYFSHSISFASDNYSGIHPEVLAAITHANQGHVGAYGNDPYTAHLQTLIQQHFGEQAIAFPVFNGTGANVLALQALLPRWGAVICANSAHIHQDESTAPQAVGGFKLWTIPTPDGKLTPERIAQEAHGYGFEHRAQPLVVSITQSTECGTLYSPTEIRAITDYCHAKGMKVHMDGARLANACAAWNSSLRELSSDVGIDVLSFGGTKNGLLMGECVVVLQGADELGESLTYLRKLNMQLASKMRFLSAQLIALLEHDLWRRSAQHANTMAAQLAAGLHTLQGVKIAYPVEANAVFAYLPAGVADKVREQFTFYDWDNHGLVRFMCSFDTQPEHVAALLNAIQHALPTS